MSNYNATLLALLTSLSLATVCDGDEMSAVAAVAVAHQPDDDKKFVINNKNIMRTPHYNIARLLLQRMNKRRSIIEADNADVGVLSSSSSSGASASPIAAISSTNIDAPNETEPTIPRQVDVVSIESSSSSYSVTMGSLPPDELFEKCSKNCPNSLLCKCFSSDSSYECYNITEDAFCNDSKCLPPNEAALIDAYFCPMHKCTSNIDGFDSLMDAYATGGDDMSPDVYEQMLEMMNACTYCVGRTSLCGKSKEDTSFCNTVFQTSFGCDGVNCTLGLKGTELVSDVCSGSYVYGQFIDCNDFPELSVDNYFDDDKEGADSSSDADNDKFGGEETDSSSSNRAVLGSCATLVTIVSVGLG